MPELADGCPCANSLTKTALGLEATALILQRGRRLSTEPPSAVLNATLRAALSCLDSAAH